MSSICLSKTLWLLLSFTVLLMCFVIVEADNVSSKNDLKGGLTVKEQRMLKSSRADVVQYFDNIQSMDSLNAWKSMAIFCCCCSAGLFVVANIFKILPNIVATYSMFLFLMWVNYYLEDILVTVLWTWNKSLNN
eukprot:TRINITY_DN646_c0_g1_i2.p1 TRINITY_DN646_c0_g1~~TRINITY_DN646_c0_g1_i2.p1  ORF type:complete len:134 (-),score=1.22 TRINITY_DN646_c0_g1_i2:50-451(-)